MRKTIFIGLGVSLLACVPAQATTFNLGPLTNGVAYFETETLTKSNTFDIFNFSIAAATGLGAGVQNDPLKLGVTSFNFSSLTAQIFAKGTTTNPIGTLSGGDAKTFSITDGSYYAKVTGVQTGTAGGEFTLGLLSGKAAAPAPGPDGWLVMGAGLAALAFFRRRASSSTAQALAV